MADAITDRTRLIFVCNPNNPTGTVVARADLERFLDRVPSDVLVVIDEAYREFVRDPRSRTASSSTATGPTSPSCAPSPRPTAWPACASASRSRTSRSPRRCARRAVPFGVNQLAQAAAIASLRAENALLERVERAGRGARPACPTALRAQGWTVPTPRPTSSGCASTSARWSSPPGRSPGIVVRPFPGEGARITIGETDANDILLQVAGEFRE